MDGAPPLATLATLVSSTSMNENVWQTTGSDGVPGGGVPGRERGVRPRVVALADDGRLGAEQANRSKAKTNRN